MTLLRIPYQAASVVVLGPTFAGASINFLESVSMVPLSTFGETFVKFAQISLKKKGRGVSEGPRREKKSEKFSEHYPTFETLDMDSIMLVIGLVEMLNFLKKMAI